MIFVVSTLVISICLCLFALLNVKMEMLVSCLFCLIVVVVVVVVVFPLSKTSDNYIKRMIERSPAQQGFTLQRGINLYFLITKNREQNRTSTKLKSQYQTSHTHTPVA